jgi:site-specific DNA recombinase
MTRAAIYVRISADREGKALGVQRQEDDCRALAARMGWTVMEVYCDNDVSAYSGKVRPEYRRMLAAVKAGEVSAVIAYAPDRLYRRMTDLTELLDTLKKARCVVRTVAAGEVDLSTTSGWQMAMMLGVVAEGESRRTGERIKRKLDQRKAEGLPHGGHRPYGWELDRLTIREAEAQTIRWGISQTLAGVPIRAQFRELNERGSTNSRGGPWTHGTYRGVLLAARHAGLMTDGSPATWPAIVTPEQHRAARRLLSDPQRVTTPGRAGKLHLLSGLARCAVCGGPLRASKGKDGSAIYRCYPSGEVQCGREHLDGLVLQVLAERLRRPDAVRLLTARSDDASQGVRAAAARQAATLRLRLEEAAEQFAAGDITGAQLRTISARVREELDVAERATEPPRDRAAVLGKVLGAPDRGAAFLALETARQRAVIELLLGIRLAKGRRGPGFRPERVEIEWK